MNMRRARAGNGPALKHAALALACGVALATATCWSRVAVAGDATAANATTATGDLTEFNRSMLAGGGKHVTDLSRFEHGNPVLAGVYNLDVYVNRAWVGRMDVRFAAPTPKASAVPCVTHALLNRMGLSPATADLATATRLQSAAACVQLGQLIPAAKLVLDLPDLRLDASIPQAYSGQLVRGYVNPASLDPGVPAFLLNYNLNAYHTSNAGVAQTSAYLGLDAGLNLGLWHFRQNSTLTWQSGVAGATSQRRWRNIDAYVQRDLPKLRARLTIGDSYTDGAVFDSFAMRGVQLATNDQMLPQSLRGYAPVVRGVADTNAKVTISQNGVQIYQTTVAPGPFVIRDLYPTGYGGDLDVTVTEADGRRRSFSVPYASIAQLLRPGVTRFDVTAGQLRDDALQDKPGVLQAAVQHGFSNIFTGYAGLQGSAGYAAALVGAAFNTRFGALALDVTQAHANIPGYGTHDGQSFRITYSKIIPATDTSLTVAAYRYSTSGFLSLQNAAYARDYARHNLGILQLVPSGLPTINGVPDLSLLTPAQRAALSGTAFDGDAFAPRGLLQQRDRFTLTLNQRLGIGGSLYANASINDYWNHDNRDSQFQLGYNNRFRRLSYGISVGRARTQLGGYDNRVFFNASLPLGGSAHAPSLSVNLNHSDAGGTNEQATVNGTAGQWNQFIYGATASHGSAGVGNAVSVNAGYNTPYAILSASAGKGSGYSQESFGAGGAIVAHRGGVTFGQPLGDTAAIVHIPGATGAHILNAPGVRVDRFGYALVPYLAPYQSDTIQIDPQGLPLGVQLDATSANVAPYAGAMVMVDFESHYARALILRIRNAGDGKPLPFGSEVQDAQGSAVGTVGQGGLTLLRVPNQAGQLNAHWQDAQGVAQACSFAYAVPAPGKTVDATLPSDVACAASVEAPSTTPTVSGP